MHQPLQKQKPKYHINIIKVKILTATVIKQESISFLKDSSAIAPRLMWHLRKAMEMEADRYIISYSADASTNLHIL